MKSLDHFSAAILAGGKSSRMGSDKGLVLLHGKEMVLHVIDVLKPMVENIRIVANTSGYTNFGLPVVEDMIKDKGPIGGIVTALTFSENLWNFIVACDMPFLNTEIIWRLTNNTDNFDAVVPFYDGRPQPLCAFYNQSSLPAIKLQIDSGNYKLQDLLKVLRVKFVDFTGEFTDQLHPFRNFNSKEELIKISGS